MGEACFLVVVLHRAAVPIRRQLVFLATLARPLCICSRYPGVWSLFINYFERRHEAIFVDIMHVIDGQVRAIALLPRLPIWLIESQLNFPIDVTVVPD